MRIEVDDLSRPQVHELLAAHLAGMRATSPQESAHALDLDGLRQPDVTLWSAWDGDALMGCGALRMLDDRNGEVKSMRTAEAFLRRGVAAAMLEHVLTVARERGLDRVSLETGSGDGFAAAHKLYARSGFLQCGPFGDYTDDPFSRFFTLAL
jgi:putative acetyltransferase